jgi:Zn-finger nucleic acid-binding protein
MSERQGIEIDYCPQCRGVWLDRGELDKIIERSEQTPPPQRQEVRRESPFEDIFDDRERKRRKRGFLGDLFD